MFGHARVKYTLFIFLLFIAGLARAETPTETRFEWFRAAFRQLLDDPDLAKDDSDTLKVKRDKYKALTRELNNWAQTQGLYFSQPLAYIDENFIENHPHLQRGNSVYYIKDRKELDSYQLTIRKGKIEDSKGGLFDTRNETLNGSYLYVMDPLGRLYAYPKEERYRFHHSTILAGLPVAGAGKLWVRNGVLLALSDESGHYSTHRFFTEQVREVLQKGGIKNDYIIDLLAPGPLESVEADYYRDHLIPEAKLQPHLFSNKVKALFAQVEHISSNREEGSKPFIDRLRTLFDAALPEMNQNPLIMEKFLKNFILRGRTERADNATFFDSPETRDFIIHLTEKVRAITSVPSVSQEATALAAYTLVVEHLFLAKNNADAIKKAVLNARYMQTSKSVLDLLDTSETSQNHKMTSSKFTAALPIKLSTLRMLLSLNETLTGSTHITDPMYSVTEAARTSLCNVIGSWLSFFAIQGANPSTRLGLSQFLGTGVEEALKVMPATKSWLDPHSTLKKLHNIVTDYAEPATKWPMIDQQKGSCLILLGRSATE